MHIPFFHQNNSPLDQVRLDQEGNPIENGEVKPNNSKKIIILGAIGILLILIGILLFIPTQNLPFAKPAPTSTPAILLAMVGNQPIYLSQVEVLARQQYGKKSLTKTILNNYLNILIERALLDELAKQKNIAISQTEINNFIQQQNLNSTNVSSSFKEEIKYQLLKEKITQEFVTERSAYVIGFWIPPLSEEQKPEFAQYRTQGAAALRQAETLLKNGQQPLRVVETLYTRYPLIQNRFSLNGYRYGQSKENAAFLSPRVYQEQNQFSDFYTFLASVAINEVKYFSYTNGSGGVVIQVTNIKLGEYTSYNDFLSQMKKKLVKIVKPI